MTTYVTSQVQSTSGTWYLDTGYNELVTSTGALISTNSDALLGPNSNHVVTVLGRIEGVLSGIVLGDNVTNDNNETVRIGSTGYVYGGSVDGIRVAAYNSNVRNEGTVFGRDTGIEMNANIGTSRLVNSGTILGDYEGIRSTGAQTLIIENTGTIFGQTRAIATFGGATANITNTGEIVGEIYLDSGNDIYNGVNGRVSGPISCFGGNDTVNAGVDDDTIDGMSGNDVLNGGLGNDTVYGGDGIDKLYGGNGNDYLDGGGSADNMYGGKGDDTYVVQNTGDVTDETGGDSIHDLVKSTITWTITSGIDDLTLTGGRVINGTGSSGNNIIAGNAAINTLKGNGGNDTFLFNTTLSVSNYDIISDFDHASDVFHLDNAVFLDRPTGVPASSSFQIITTATSNTSVDSNDYLLYYKAEGNLYFDRDGSGTTYSRVLFAVVADNTNLDYTDFTFV
jgi:Ca2+-binding RTX toxin-like protein